MVSSYFWTVIRDQFFDGPQPVNFTRTLFTHFFVMVLWHPTSACKWGLCYYGKFGSSSERRYCQTFCSLYTSAIYLFPSAALIMSFLPAWKFYQDADSKSSRKLFLFSLIHLPVIMTLMIISKKHYGRNKKTEAVAAAASEGVEGVTKDQISVTLGTWCKCNLCM